MIDAKTVKKLLDEPVKDQCILSNGKSVSVIQPHITCEFDKHLMYVPMQHHCMIDTPYHNVYGTGISMMLYADNHKWYLSDNGNLDFMRGSLAFNEIVPKHQVKLFNETLKDAMHEYHIKGEFMDSYYYPLKSLHDLHRGYLNQVSFQMFYLQVMSFLINGNTGKNASSQNKVID